jgi:hypothetical protein
MCNLKSTETVQKIKPVFYEGEKEACAFGGELVLNLRRSEVLGCSCAEISGPDGIIASTITCKIQESHSQIPIGVKVNVNYDQTYIY